MASTGTGTITIQTNAHKASIDDITNYSLMLGGLNVTHAALDQYDPLITGYTRIFMVRKPILFTNILVDEFTRFKHILEYGNTAIDGNSDATLDSAQVNGGYVGRSFDIPTITKDDSNQLSVKTFEFSGSPIREILHFWCNAIADNQSGYASYGGLIQSGQLSYKQANHTAEFIVVSTDRTGMKVENACMWANCFPKGYKNDQFNYSSGTHDLVETTVDFYGTKYESAEINKKAEILLKKYQILVNSLEFNSGLNDQIVDDGNIEIGYNAKTGKLEKGSQIKYRTTSDPLTNKSGSVNYDYTTYDLTTPSYTKAGANYGSNDSEK